MKKMIILVIVLLVLGAVLFAFNSFISNKEAKDNRTTYSAEDTKDNKAEYSAKEDLPKQIKNTVWASDYAMDWKLNVKKDLLEEVVAITITNVTDKPVSQLYFRNMAHSILEYDKKNGDSKKNRNKKSVIESVKINGKNVGKISYQKDKSVFFVDLKEDLKPNETTNVTIYFHTDIPVRQDRFSVQKFKYGKMYALSFCYPYLAPFRNGKWNTDPYFDDGETRANEVSNYTVTMKAPKDYLIAATGIHSTNGDTTKIESKNIRDFALVACNFMKEKSFKASGVKVNNYYLPGKYAERYCKITELVVQDTLKILTNKIGPYPYETLDIAPCIFGLSFGGMEYPGLCMNNATAYFDKGTITAKFDPISLMEIVTHELAHQWFYAAVGSDEYNEAWLDEGFTSYCEKILYGLEETKSLEYANTYSDPRIDIKKYRKENDELIKEISKEHKKSYLNVSVKDYTEDDLYGDREYDQSVNFLCELRIAMGDRNFFKFMKKYYSNNMLGFVTSQTVVDTIKDVDDSKNVCRIIDKYIKK